jgi:septum formation protein
MTGPRLKVVLASGSPRRRELLAALIQDFEVIPADVDEELTLDAHADAVRLAASKAAAVAERLPGGVVIGSDTIVHMDGRSYGKPQDSADAVRMLAELRGRKHCVVTGVAIKAGDSSELEASETDVWLCPMTDEQIGDYVASGRPMDKAGSYAIQDADVPTVERISGCYCSVMGLPLWRLKRMLERSGVVCRAPDETLAQCVTCPERNL